jgi:hypothetical protein
MGNWPILTDDQIKQAAEAVAEGLRVSAPGAHAARKNPFEHRLVALEARVLSLADKQAGIIDDLLLLMRHVEARMAAIERNTALLDTVDSIQRAQADLEQRLAAAGPQGAQLSRAKVAGGET